MYLLEILIIITNLIHRNSLQYTNPENLVDCWYYQVHIFHLCVLSNVLQCLFQNILQSLLIMLFLGRKNQSAEKLNLIFLLDIVQEAAR